MASGFGESESMSPASGACGGSGSNDVGDFECNICFELAQDPIVTLCGHLYCWPCLYEWLHHHSHSQECPVCKALIQEEKLVPLYGRGKTPSDPRSKSIPNDSIPSRPAGQRPETAPPVANPVSHLGVGLMRGFAPLRTARFGNFALSAAFGHLSPSLLNIHVHGFPDPRVYGATPGYPFWFSNAMHGGLGHMHRFPHPISQRQRTNYYLKNLLLFTGVLMILALIW